MNYVPHGKQKLAHKAILLDGYKRAVLLMGRQCFVGNTLVATPDGYTHIKDLKVGDRVLSSDGYKKIINTWQYWVDTDPKPMIQFKVDEETITSTYDHKFYLNGEYIPAYQFAWRAMATSERSQLKLLCEQYGQPFDYEEAQQRGLDISNEASFGPFWVSKDGFRREDSKSTQDSGADLATESAKQIGRKPHRRRQNQQPDNELGVADASREYFAHAQDGQSSKQTRGELRDSHTQRETSTRDSEVERHFELPTTGREIWGVVLHDSGHYTQKNVVSSVTVHTTVETYAIDVEDTHDYCITTKNILVGNSGKTYFAVNHTWLSAMIHQGRYFIVFSTYKQAHDVVWRQYLSLIPKALIKKTNEQNLSIELNYVNGSVKMPDGSIIQVEHDQTKPNSVIQLLGSDQADSHRGFKADGIVFDEYGDQAADNFKLVYEPMFTTTDGWAIFLGTPRGFNHFYDLIQYARDDERWYYLEATWRDSPYVKKEFISEVRREAEKRNMLSGFMQEYELEFRSVQGAVYPVFNRNIHVIKPAEIPENLTYYGAIDFGWHTLAFLLLGVDKDQTWYVVDEVYGKEETLDNVIPRIKNVIGDKRIVLMVADSANRDAIEVMGREFPVVGVNKANDTKGYQLGIGLVTEKLKPKEQLIGKPKPSLYLSSVCKNLLFELESYKFPEEKANRNPADVPVKENDHGPDAIRYLFLHLKHGINKEETLPKPSMKFNNYGFPL